MYGITPQHIRDAAFGITIPTDSVVSEQLASMIAKAETRIASRVPSLAARAEVDPDLRAVVGGVIEDMVLRVVKNPRSLRTLGIDDFQATIDNSVSTGMLYLTPEELALLAPKSNRKARSIRLGVPGWRLPGA